MRPVKFTQLFEMLRGKAVKNGQNVVTALACSMRD